MFGFGIEGHMRDIPFLNSRWQLIEALEQTHGLTGQLKTIMFHFVTGKFVERDSVDIRQLYQSVDIRCAASGFIVGVSRAADT